MDAIFAFWIRSTRATTAFAIARSYTNSHRVVPFYRPLSTDQPASSERIVTAGEKKAFKKKLDRFYNMMQVPGESQVDVQVIDENGQFLGVRSKSYARKMAFGKEMVLVDLNLKDVESIFCHKTAGTRQFSGDKPICAIMNPKSDEYRELKRIVKDSRKVEKASKIRKHTLRFPLDIAGPHLEAKLKQIDSWLSKGDMIEIFLKMNNLEDRGKIRAMEEKVAAIVGTRSKTRTTMNSDRTLCIEILPSK